jgi:hypothetical protein
MLLLARCLFLFGLLLVGGVAETRQLASADPIVKVAIFDDVQLSPDVLAHAQEEATRVFRKAEIQILWMVCKSKSELRPDSGCTDAAEPKHLALRIVPRAWKSSDSIFGVAFLSQSGTGAYGDIFYDSVEKLHRDWGVGVSLPRVLGHVMAHELGHLLLGSNAHSRDGIMRPSWHVDELQRVSKGVLLFSPEQAQSIRERLSRDPK